MRWHLGAGFLIFGSIQLLVMAAMYRQCTQARVIQCERHGGVWVAREERCLPARVVQ